MPDQTSPNNDKSSVSVSEGNGTLRIACMHGCSGRARTADVLGKAVRGAEHRWFQTAGPKCGKERRHGLGSDGLRAAHHKLQVAQVPLSALLLRRFPAIGLQENNQHLHDMQPKPHSAASTTIRARSLRKGRQENSLHWRYNSTLL